MGPLSIPHPSQIHQHYARIESGTTVEWDGIPGASIMEQAGGHPGNRRRGIKLTEFGPEGIQAPKENDVRVQVENGVIGQEFGEEEPKCGTRPEEATHPSRTCTCYILHSMDSIFKTNCLLLPWLTWWIF